MKTYSTLRVAKILGIGTETLYRWMHEAKIPMPQTQSLGGMTVRLWSEADLKAAQKYKAEHYWGKRSKRKYRKRKRRAQRDAPVR